MKLNRTLLALAGAITLGQTASHAAVVYTEDFDDISDWTVVATSPNTSIAATGGKLTVGTGDPIVAGTEGLYLSTAVAPVAEGRIYYWGFIATGTRDVSSPANNGPGPVGAFNVSETSGLKWFNDAPLGAYIRNRDEPGTGIVTELQLVTDEDNPGFAPNLPEGGDGVDFMIEYSGTTATLYLKNTSGSSWGVVSSHAFGPGSSDYFLNISLLGEGITGEGAAWELDQIDIEDSTSGAFLTSASVPEPASLALLGVGVLMMIPRRR